MEIFYEPDENKAKPKKQLSLIPKFFNRDIALDQEEYFEVGGPKPKKRRLQRSTKSLGKSLAYKQKKKRFHLTINRVLWAIFILLSLRLVFMDRGLIDYYRMDSILMNKEIGLDNLKIENKDLAAEIKLIKTSRKYQKQLVRDHLGVIAEDEYLVLFTDEQKKD